MRVLELFSGTGSVGKVCKRKKFEVVSLDLKNADININILEWDFKNAFAKGHFDIIWASPPCETFSGIRECHKGKNGYTDESLRDDMMNIGVPILFRTLEIIHYFEPRYFFIENPQSGKMKEFLKFPYFDVDYCKYARWGYRKRTRIWTNQTQFVPRVCNGDCGQIVPGTTRHARQIGTNGPPTLNMRYRIPPKLIFDLFRNVKL